jgi:tRNA(Ile)-lysidine synthase
MRYNQARLESGAIISNIKIRGESSEFLMDKKIKSLIEKYKLQKEKAVILAISGGPDSVALLDLMVRYFPKEKIVVAHANHGIRLEARWDENFVTALSEEYGVRYICERLHLTSTSEAAAREARYQFLNDLAEEIEANYILTAHHLNDQAETVLLSLTRGSGPLSVWGMSELEGRVLRPLLEFTKDDILKYVNKRHLRYHLDRTNFDTRYARNRVRAKVVPQLKKLNPKFLETLGRNAELGREMEAAWGVVLSEKEKKISNDSGLDIKKLLKEPVYIQKELIRRKLSLVLQKKDGITQENVSKVHDLLYLPRGKKTEIGSLSIVRGVSYLSFGNKKVLKKQKTEKLNLNTPLHFNGYVLKMTEDSGKATKNNVLLPISIGYNLNIRTWREGDRIITKSGTKKLSDVFTDAKISAAERRNWPVVVAGKKIVWVPKLTASADALSESKKKVIKIGVQSERKKK